MKISRLFRSSETEYRAALAAIAAAGMTFGCGASPDGESAATNATPTPNDVSTVGERIQNGQITSDYEAYGLVFLELLETDGSLAFCSGVLVSNTWVLTAKHCLQGASNALAWSKGATSLDQVASATRFVQNPDPSTDVGLMQLSQPLKAGFGQTSGYKLPIYTANLAQATGMQLICLGYGNSNADETTNNPNFGKPQIGSLKLNQILSDWTYQATPWSSNSPQLMMPGDSGGPCFDANAFVPLLVGIQSNLFLAGTPDAYDSQVRSDTFASWVSSTIG